MLQFSPLVSIIVPNYNHENYLEQRLDSIYQQTYQNFEVILLDDSSTDRSVDILERYRLKKKIRIIEINKTNTGIPFKQWEKGIKLSKGEIIWIAESDDYADITFLENLIPFFQDENVGVVHCNSILINENNKKIGLSNQIIRTDKKAWKQNFKKKGLIEIKKHLRYSCTILNASATLFRKRYYSNDNKFINYKYCGDWMFWVEILSKSNFVFCSSYLNFFRQSKKSYSGQRISLLSSSQKLKEQLSIIGYAHELCSIPFKFSIIKHYWIVKYWVGNVRCLGLYKQYWTSSSIGHFKYIHWILFFPILCQVTLEKIYRLSFQTKF